MPSSKPSGEVIQLYICYMQNYRKLKFDAGTLVRLKPTGQLMFTGNRVLLTMIKCYLMDKNGKMIMLPFPEDSLDLVIINK
jgi:hypothetical protein